MLGRTAFTSNAGGRAAAPRRAFAAAAPLAPRAALLLARSALSEAALVPVMEKGEMSAYPEQPGVYAVYDAAGSVQYIGLSRKVQAATRAHARARMHTCMRARAGARPAQGGGGWSERSTACAAVAAPGRPKAAYRLRTQRPQPHPCARTRRPPCPTRRRASNRKPHRTPLKTRAPQVNASVAAHMQSVPDLTHAVRFKVVESGGKEELTSAWKEWMEQASEWQWRPGDG